jgi:hypothetical protein
MKVSIISLGDKLEHQPLCPAPNISDSGDMAQAFKETTFTDADLVGGHVKIVYSYRGSMLYLENRDLVYRYNPKTQMANGYVSMPSDPEECYVRIKGDWYAAKVGFTSD